MSDESKTVPGFEPDFEPMKLGASIPISLIRRDYEEHGIATMIKNARECFKDPTVMTDAMLIAIARGEATLRGYSPPGYSYHKEPCATCNGRGRVTEGKSHKVVCPTCEGDTFAPPVAEMAYRKAGLK